MAFEDKAVKSLFEPESIVVVGASKDQDKLGSRILKQLTESGCQSKLFTTNPKGGDILGLKAEKKVKDISEQVDLAYVCVPAKFALDAVKDCADSGVKVAAVVTSGFSEVNNDGKILEEKMVDYAHSKGMRILGPNIVGTYTKKKRANGLFTMMDMPEGDIAVVSQSGGVLVDFIGKISRVSEGFSSMIALGNKSDIDEAFCLDYLAEDPDTKAIMMYIEGIKNGEQFVSKLKKAAKEKPVLIIKSGSSERGAVATASHTGSLAVDDAVATDIFDQCGALRSKSPDRAITLASYLKRAPAPKGDNLLIITNSGGTSILSTDAASRYGLDMYGRNTREQKKLTELFAEYVPDYGSTKNPIDTTAARTPEQHLELNKAAIDSDEIDSVMITLGEAVIPLYKIEEIVRETEKYNESKGEKKKPVYYHFFGTEKILRKATEMREDGLPVSTNENTPMKCIGSLFKYHQKKDRVRANPPSKECDYIDFQSIDDIVADVKADGRTFLLADEAKVVMEAAGITIPVSHIASDKDEAVEYAKQIGGEVVMKVVSKDIIHKSDAGGVKVGINGDEDVKKTFDEIMENCLEYDSAADIKGIEVVEMVKQGIEVIVGAKRDPSFGDIVMVGEGGIYVELRKDVKFLHYPAKMSEIEDALWSTEYCSEMMSGVRGQSLRDYEAVIEAVDRVGRILQHCPDISDIEINPVMAYAYGDGIKAVDARILLKEE